MTLTDIYAALNSIMRDVSHVGKGEYNQGLGFKFRGIDAVTNAVGPALREHGVIVTPHLQTVNYSEISLKSGAQATSCRVVVLYRFTAGDATYLDSIVAAESMDTGDKATAKAMSVAFRIALLQALALPTDEADPDEYTYEQAKGPQNGAQDFSQDIGELLSEKQKNWIEQMANRLELTHEQKINGYIHVLDRPLESTDELTKNEASTVIDAMKTKLGD